MKMINCHECGAQNPAQSKYCNNCGASLESDTTHICPACETPNPIDLLYCDNCGTRLVDDPIIDDSAGDEPPKSEGSRSEPFSLPSRPPGDTGNLEVSGDIPEWLKTGEFSTEETRQDQDQEEPEWLQAAQEDEPWEDDDAPTLDEVSGDHAPQDDLPTWLLDDDTRQEIFRGDRGTDELFMASLAGDEDVDPQETGSLLEGDIPEWLQGLSDAAEETLPEMSGQAASGAGGQGDRFSEEEEDGAREAEQEQDLEKSGANATAELQGWLTDLESAESEGEDLPQNADSASDEEASDESDSGVAQDPDSGTDTTEEEILGWLTDVRDDVEDTERPQNFEDEQETPADHGGSLDAGSEAPTRSSDEAQDADEIEGEEEEVIEESPMSEVPDWPLNTGDEAEEAEQLSPPQETDDDVPAWLQEMDSSLEDFPPDEPEPEATEWSPGDEPPELASEESEEAEPDADTAVEDEMPQEDFLEWLEELDESAEQSEEEHVDVGPPAAENRQDSLRDDEPQPVERQQEIAQEDDVTDRTDPDSELPDWLSGVTSELDDSVLESDVEDAEETGTSPQPRERPQTPVDDEESERVETAREHDLPAKATDDFPAPESKSDVADAVVNAEDLPDWFSDVMDDIKMAEQEQADEASGEPEAPPELANVPQQLAGGELPEWLDSPFEGNDTDAEPTPIEEIPEWLRSPLQANLAKEPEESTRPLDEAQSDEDWDDLLDVLPPPGEETEKLSEASVPDWLEALKPEALGGEATSTPAPQKEMSGPLAGLNNVISVAPAIAQPRPSGRIGQPTTGAGRERQTELLRQLTRSAGHGAVKIGAPAPVVSSASRGIRLLLAILLVSAVIMGLLYPTSLENIGPLQEGFMPEAENALAAAAGQPVVVAFEYTPAMAGALNPEADALLESFVDSDSTVIAVSQSAAGVAMAEQSLQRTGAQEADVLGYIPGGPVGLRRLRRCLRADSDCQTLYGRTLNSQLRDALSNTALIVVLAGDANELLDWIEQVGTSTETPLLAAVTPSVAPVAAPYRSSGQLTGVLSNIVQAEAAPDGSTLAGTSTALTLSQWLAAAAILLGGIYFVIVGSARSNEAPRHE